MLFWVWFHMGQSRLRCPCFLHLKHFPSFIKAVLSSVVNRSISIVFGSRCFGNVNVFFGASFFDSIDGPRPSIRWVFLQLPWNALALSYHSSRVTGGFSLSSIGHWSPRGSVSRNRSVTAAESLSPDCDIRSLNLAKCSSMVPSPSLRCSMAYKALPGASYGWNDFSRLSMKFLYVPKVISLLAVTLSVNRTTASRQWSMYAD